MIKIGNVELYDDDEEIIMVLHKLPELEECDNMNVLRYMQEKTKKADFGSVIFIDDIVYTVYKFDKDLIKPEDAGLIMTKSHKDHFLEQLNIWIKFKETGMSFSNKIFNLISDTLSGQHFAKLFYGFNE